MALSEFGSCALTEDGAVVCWGIVLDVPSKFQAPGSTLALSGSTNYACAVRAGGDVDCWGTAFVPDGLRASGSAAASVASSNGFSCVITANSTVQCFGDNSNPGQQQVPANFSGAVQVCTGGSHACAGKGDGRVICWGDNSALQAKPPADLVDVMMVACGERFTLAVTKAGALRAWGAYKKLPYEPGPAGIGALTSAGAFGNGRVACAVLDGGPNECKLGTADCHPNATCQDTIGGFNCTCKAGFSGDGVTCTYAATHSSL